MMRLPQTVIHLALVRILIARAVMPDLARPV
jgi:hypothetical protein